MKWSGVIETLSTIYVNRIDDIQTQRFCSISRIDCASVVGRSAVQVVGPMVGAKAGEGGALFEGTRKQSAKIAFHFRLDLIKGVFKTHAHILFVISPPINQRDARGIGSG